MHAILGWSASNVAYQLGHPSRRTNTIVARACLGMLRTHRHRLSHFLVHDDVDLDALLGLALQ